MFNREKSDIQKLSDFVEIAKKLPISKASEYPSVRAELNVRAIAAILGIDFDCKEDGTFEITKVHSAPSSEDIFETVAIVNDFISSVESRFSIPSKKEYIVIPEKVDKKAFADMVFGNLVKPLTINDFMAIGKIGTELRKYMKRRRNFIVGGIVAGTILIAGGVFYIKRSGKL